MSEKPAYKELEQRIRELEKAGSERKRTQEVSKRNERLLKLYMEFTPAATAMCDLQMRYIAYSRRWITDYHLPEENLLGRCHYDVFKTIPEHWKQEHRRCFDGEIIVNEEEPFTRADGSVDWVRRNLHPWRTEDGEVGGLIMFTEVVTEKKEAEEALRRSEEKFRNLADMLPIAIFETDEKLIVEYANKKACELFGYSSGDLEGSLSALSMIVPEEHEKVAENLNRRKAGKFVGPTEYIAVKKDGTTFPVLLYINKKEDWSKGLRGVVVDITERKQAEKDKERLRSKLQQSQKLEAIGTLAGGIAHNFNNLLMGIQGRTSLMMAKKNPKHPDCEHLQGIEECVNSAAELTKDLLGFARGGKYEVKPTDLNEIIKHENRIFGRTKKEIRIHEKYEEEIWPAEVDRGQVQQALLNLYVNAWQAMPGGGDLYVRTANVTVKDSYAEPLEIVAGRYVKISVTDAGTGIDDAIKEKIFDPFFSTKDIGQGSGLGLSSVYGIIKNHNGFINVYSEKGEGTTFNIYLPASENVVEEVVPNSELKEMQYGKGTILLVDDEDMIIEVGRQMLEILGYRALVAFSSKEALEVYRKQKNEIDLVILDMIMPGLGGGETFDRLKRIDEDVRVLLSSGYSINGQAKEILDRGCGGFVQKPFSLNDLSIKIKKLLDETEG